MRFQLISDLHLERDPLFQCRPAKGAEVLILAGDIGSYQSGSLLAARDFGLSRFSPSSGPWDHVLFVPGNHEYDQLDFLETHSRLADVCESLGITFLERSSIVLSGIRILGTTLWSDFDALTATLKGPVDNEKAIAIREKAFRAANFYLRKNSTLAGGAQLLAADIRELGLTCQKWLTTALAEPFEGKTLVVSHFAPSLRSADPRYGITPGTAGFCNSLDHLFPYVDVWAHGHLHCPNIYQAGRCRVVSNSLGYRAKGEQVGFIPDFTFDL
ncbi:metallophosphoesterase [Roseateles flavus]|uniref:Metallophosphoesterase n=1 Tax=Roseateles flavus TaxID=3149041 RepID=A0ABV0G8X3_9BURK